MASWEDFDNPFPRPDPDPDPDPEPMEIIPCDDYALEIEQTESPIRFFEYPWNKKNKILINEVSRLHRLVQLHDIGIRLEKIKK